MEERINDTGVSQHHFNTNKLNDYLTGKAKMMGCNIFDDEIDDVIINEQGPSKTIEK